MRELRNRPHKGEGDASAAPCHPRIRLTNAGRHAYMLIGSNEGSMPLSGREALTKNQICVLEKLERASGPLSAYTLLDQLREQGFRAPLQVYRALDTLVKGGFVHRL